MASTAFISTQLNFESDKTLFNVTTDSDYVYIMNDMEEAENVVLKISIDDWFEIVTYIEKQLK